MTRRIFLHIGLPKTGTSYLQTIVWDHRPHLREAGLLVPGRERRDHLWASLDVRDDPSLHRRGRRAPSAWPTLLEEIGRWPGDVLVSHEFFCSAAAAQARSMTDALRAAGGADTEVHVVVTAREPLSLFTSSWQEHLKNKGTTRIADYARSVSEDPTVIWDWRALDLRLVLERWAGVTEPEHVHVVTAPGRDQPRDELWHRFASVIGVPAATAGPGRFENSSMGLAEAETLRRLNERLDGFDRALDRGVWIRSFLADDRLVPRGGEPFWPGADQVAECRQRGIDAVTHVRDRGYDVVGDLAALQVPEVLSPRRDPGSVTDAEVAEVAVDLVADLLGEVRSRSTADRRARSPEPDLRKWPGVDWLVRRLRSRGSSSGR